MVHPTSPTPRTLEESEITANTSTAAFLFDSLWLSFGVFFYIIFEIILEKIFSAHRLLNVRTKNGPITKLDVE